MLSCLVLFAFSACDSDDYDTNQYTGGVSLSAFGPSPVVRGGTLRFLGSNLDQVTQVEIPGISPITDITVRQAGVPSEILVQVPKDGPEEGYVTLTTASGQTITTQTMLTYEESIEFTSFSPTSAMPGDVITIEGDYLNLIHEVIFADEIVVPETEFITHDRYTIEVAVPEEARTGQIIISDAEEDLPNWIYSEEELNVGLPAVTSLTASRFKAGETLTLTGTDLNLVDYIQFEGVQIASASLAGDGEASFTVSSDGKTITLTQPAEAASGEVYIIARSGVEVLAASEEEFQVVVPSELAVSPAPVKAGASLTITGADLDLVTSVVFPSGVDGGTFTAETAQLVVEAVPTSAVDGDITLNMANGMSVTVAYELVKPTVTAYSVEPVSAGSELTITGTDLDLVSSVSFGGSEAVTPSEISDTSLTVTVPMDAASGVVTLNLVNGTSVEAQELSVEEAVFCYVTEWPDTEETELKAGELLTVTVANSDVLTDVEVNGSSVQYVLLSNTLYIGLPETAGSGTVVRLISSNGEISYTIDVTPNTEITTVIWTGASALSWTGMSDLSWGAYDWSTVSAGTDLTAYFTLDTAYDYWQIRFGNGSWAALPGTDDVISLEAGATSYTITLTQEMIDELVNNGGLVMTGTNYILSKITLTEHISLETSIILQSGTHGDSEYWSFPVAMNWSAGSRFAIFKDTPVDLSSYVKVGATLRFYASGTGQIQINDANWSAIEYVSEWSDSGSHVFEVTLTQAYVDAFNNGDGWSSAWLICQGDGLTVTDVTIE